ncbi:MAG TPA: acetyltransferase [Allosphingosinicella sp.]|nr:acetyltransferase [Allosphingosinicella sp.]
MRRLVIYGAGGFGREVVTAARFEDRDLVFMSDGPAVDFGGIPHIGITDLTPDDEVVIAIADTAVRRRLAARCQRFATLIAPTAVIGNEVEIGEGSIICDFAMVTASARIGRHFHCNIYSYVAHDCVIGDFVTFAPKVCCNGNVHVGDGAYIGTGAVIKNGVPGRPIVIGAGAVIGCGAVVTKDVPPGVTVVGNPARPLERKLAAVA